MKKPRAFVSLLLLLLPFFAAAHSGGADDIGGHYNRKDTTGRPYHFNKGPLAGQNFKDKEGGRGALEALKGPSVPNPTTSAPIQIPAPFQPAGVPMRPSQVPSGLHPETVEAEAATPEARSRDTFSLISWNVKRLGREDFNVKLAASVLKDADLVTLQEVNVNAKGRQALLDIVTQLRSLTGESYCFAFSQASEKQYERTAFLWKNSQFQFARNDGSAVEEKDCVGKELNAPLQLKHQDKLDREPSVGFFVHRGSGRRIRVASVHLVPTGKSPQNEVPFVFDSLAEIQGPMIVAGDFNLDGGHSRFKKIPDDFKEQHKMSDLRTASDLGLLNVFKPGVKTSLSNKYQELSKPYDNMFTRGFEVLNQEVINLYDRFPSLKPHDMYEQLSDHCPIRATFRPLERR